MLQTTLQITPLPVFPYVHVWELLVRILRSGIIRVIIFTFVFIVCKLFFFFFPFGCIGSSAGKESACNAGDPGLIPGSGRSPGEGKGYPFQYYCLKNSMDREAWQAPVHRVTKSRTWTRLRNFHFQGMRTSPTRNWTHAPCSGSRVLTTGPPGKPFKITIEGIPWCSSGSDSALSLPPTPQPSVWVWSL